MKSWKHTGFNVDASRTVAPENRAEREQRCQYVLRNPFSVEKMTLESPTVTIIYRSRLNPKINRNFEVFDPVDFLAVLSQHIPDKGVQMIRYYGLYSNKIRGCARKGTGNRGSGGHLKSQFDKLKSVPPGSPPPTATATQASFSEMARPDSSSVACGPAAMSGLSEADAGDRLHRQPGGRRNNPAPHQSLVWPGHLRSGSTASRPRLRVQRTRLSHRTGSDALMWSSTLGH